MVTADKVTNTAELFKYDKAVLGEGGDEETVTHFFNINTGELIEKFPYGEGWVIGIDVQEYVNLKNEANNEYRMPTMFNKSKDENKERFVYNYIVNNSNTLSQTEYSYSEFMDIVGTVYMEASYNAKYKECAAIFSAIINRSRNKGISIYKACNSNEGVYGWLDRDKIFSDVVNEQKKIFCQKAILEILKTEKDYSNGAIQWDGVDQAKIPEKYLNSCTYPMKKLNVLIKMNAMGWKIEDIHYNNWKISIEKKYGLGSFTVQQEKRAIGCENYNYNKGKIRLHSTAQYGLTIFWEEGNW